MLEINGTPRVLPRTGKTARPDLRTNSRDYSAYALDGLPYTWTLLYYNFHFIRSHIIIVTEASDFTYYSSIKYDTFLLRHLSLSFYQTEVSSYLIFAFLHNSRALLSIVHLHSRLEPYNISLSFYQTEHRASAL